MGPSPTYHPPKGEQCETPVEHGLPLWAEPAVGYCSRRPSPTWGSRFVGARAVGPWVGEQKPLGKSPRRGNPSPESTYLPTCAVSLGCVRCPVLRFVWRCAALGQCSSVCCLVRGCASCCGVVLSGAVARCCLVCCLAPCCTVLCCAGLG